MYKALTLDAISVRYEHEYKVEKTLKEESYYKIPPPIPKVWFSIRFWYLMFKIKYENFALKFT